MPSSRPADSGAATRGYIPALRYRALTRLYDPLVSTLMREAAHKNRLVQQVAARPGQRVLDLGCGTATLSLLVKRAYPDTDILGLDADEDALSIARRKIAASGLSVELQQGLSFEPPFENQSFQHVVSSLMFHHLSDEDKARSLEAVGRLLETGGELHVLDFGEAQNLLMRFAFLGVQLLDGFSTTKGNVHGCLPPMMEAAGFVDVAETHREMTPFGTVSLYHARWPH